MDQSIVSAGASFASRPLPRHGGDLAYAARCYGEPAGGWLDLSTGVNPVPYPYRAAYAGTLSRLPDATMLAGVLAAARRHYGAGDVAVAAVPGSEAAIRTLPLIAPTGAVEVLAPTYRSHAESWRGNGRDVMEYPVLDDQRADRAIVVLGRPNNPDGRVLPRATVEGFARRLAGRGGLVVVDEAFADCEEEPTLAGAGILAFRSFGKFFGLPGLRLGFVLGPRSTVERLAACFGDWPVSGPALQIGLAALTDDGWIDATRRRLRADRARLERLVTQRGLVPVGGPSLFLTAAHDRAGDIHAGLARRGVWTRIFAERPGWIRFGLPDEAGFARLESALGATLTSKG